MAEEYCLAVAQVAGRSSCGQLGCSMLESGFQMDCLVCTYIVDQYVD